MPAALAREELHDQLLTHRPLTRSDVSALSSQPANPALPSARRPVRHNEDHNNTAARATAHAAMPHTAREYWEEVREEAHPNVVPKTRRRLRRVHREFRVSLTTGVCCAALFGQLLWMIYVKSIASTASVESHDLGVKINHIQDDIARAQKQSSRTTSTVQLEAWAKQLGLRPATQADIDPVSPSARPADMDANEALR